MLQAIIFDMDGVIVDTEFFEFQLQTRFIETLQQHHRPLPPERRAALIGCSLPQIPAIIKELSGSPLALEEIEHRYRQFFHEIFSHVDYPSIFRRDILHIIEYAEANKIKLAVASSSALKHIETILTACGIYQRFDLILSGEMFQESKPNPEIYLRTLEHLGVPAAHAVAVEDSSYGIMAAQAAGIQVIAYEETRMPVDQSAAQGKGKNMREILSLIRRLHEDKKQG
ncbi:HAD superfamily hydrolase (TIGR01509 family) [Mesocricetibacter intestinalis]|uniref:HAD superfamily hydrolase (TIGR01509 family) n=1 Tax=Mesocricetibacter intestinalis TaxID=1521930 RepID=A0A4R6VA51_9PAST|nr:HAD family phosphatase [Mesocricetibacter intestinalis]TDQ56804.1 HAD superfamily hydrolase (TIGR01509 family) [Mesocricetibacter intestinalis]